MQQLNVWSFYIRAMNMNIHVIQCSTVKLVVSGTEQKLNSAAEVKEFFVREIRRFSKVIGFVES